MIRRRRRAAAANALDEAESLFAGGRELDAIDLLTAANTARRDPRIEQRLVEMRFGAFARIGRPQPRASNVQVDDLFPAGTTLPEIRREDLDIERLRSAMVHHGCLLVRKLVGDDHVARLVDDVDLALDAYATHGAGVDREAGGGARFVPFGGEEGSLERDWRYKYGGILAVDSPPALFDVIDAFEAAGIRPLVENYFGERPALLAKKWTLRKVAPTTDGTHWHQDGAFMGADIRSLNVWLALSHCGDDAPGLDVVGRRFDHVVRTGTDGASISWTVGPELADRVAQGTTTRPIFEPGDALFFDHLTLHRTAADAGMTHDRYAIEAWFLAPSTYETMLAYVPEQGEPPRDQLPLVY